MVGRRGSEGMRREVKAWALLEQNYQLKCQLGPQLSFPTGPTTSRGAGGFSSSLTEVPEFGELVQCCH